MSNGGEDPIVLGWRERVDIPAWGIKRVRAKVDTGAKTSALHVSKIREIDEERIGFEVVIREKPERVTTWVEADLARESVVRPSSGQRQRRPVVLASLVIGPLEVQAEVGLVCREGMLCRMLVGRSAIAGHALVDSSRIYVATPRKKQARQAARKDGPR